MTREYPLQAYTRRLHFWARDFGGGVGLAREMGDLAIESGAFLRFVLDSHADDHAIKEDIAR